MKAITSADNPAFKRWLRLAGSPRDVRAWRQTLAEGVHLAEAIHASGFPVEAVLVDDAPLELDEETLEHALGGPDTTVRVRRFRRVRTVAVVRTGISCAEAFQERGAEGDDIVGFHKGSGHFYLFQVEPINGNLNPFVAA